MQITNALTRQNVEGLACTINNLKDFLCDNGLANVKDIGDRTFEHFDFLMKEYVAITGCMAGVLKREYLYTPVQLKMLKDVFLLMITKERLRTKEEYNLYCDSWDKIDEFTKTKTDELESIRDLVSKVFDDNLAKQTISRDKGFAENLNDVLNAGLHKIHEDTDILNNIPKEDLDDLEATMKLMKRFMQD